MDKSPSRSARIVGYIEAQTRQITAENLLDICLSTRIQSISAATGIAPPNVSAEIGKLYRSGTVLRIGSKPISYLSKDLLQSIFGCVFKHASFDSFEALSNHIQAKPTSVALSEHPISRHSNDTLSKEEYRFDSLIGADGSLQVSIRLAKSALIYPSGGMHTLITGETGVGKSCFVKCMYDYAVKCGSIASSASLVVFNCASYAENPQLLLSHLFGCVKGAFTGAIKDQPGLVELADGGILFLDEIHRFNAEGQEKLFLLMDTGTFRRLGETTSNRRSRTLIVGATTENPENTMLTTFLRRIPVHITLPPLRARPLAERIEMIFWFLWNESRNIHLRISFKVDVLGVLSMYNCSSNIGQLATNIKLTCATAFFDYQNTQASSLELDMKHLGEHIMSSLLIPFNSGSHTLIHVICKNTPYFVIDGTIPFEAVKAAYIS